MNLDIKQFRTITYAKLLDMLSKDKSLNAWEQQFMNNIIKMDCLQLSKNQKDKILAIVDKSRLIWNHKTILKLLIEKY